MSAAFDALTGIFRSDGFVPRRICGRWPDWLVAEHVTGNALIWSAYLILPLLIWRLAERRSELRPFRGLVLAFAAFVGLCGLGHFLDMIAFFRPLYRLTGHVLVVTGLASWWTAWSIRRAWPAIAAMKSPEELERRIAERTAELTRAIDDLKRLEVDRAYLATIVESSNDAIIGEDLDSVITSWNAAAERLLGYPAAEAIGRRITLLIPPDRIDEETTILSKARAGEPLSRFETVRLAKGGRPIDVSLSTSPIKDGDGRVVGVSKIVADITERKRAEEAVRDSERRFRALIETLPQLVWSTDAAGDNAYASPQWFAYTGCADIDGLKARWHEMLHTDDRARYESAWGASLASGAPYDMEYRLRRHDGAFRWFKVRGEPIRDADGRVVRWFGTCTDIDDQMRADEALRASERTYRAIGESIPYGIWICDAEGRNTYTSESFLRLVGLSQEECSGYGWARTIHPDDAERSLEAWKECVRDEGAWDAEQRILGADGLWHPILTRGVPIRDVGGRVVRWAGISLDISGLKRAEEALRASEDRQRRALLAARIGHWEFDLKAGRVTYLNGLKALYGRAGEPPSNSYEEAIGFLHPDDRAGVAAAVEHSRSTEVPLDIEHRVVWPDGTVRWLAAKGVVFRDQSGEPVRMVGVNVDITERREAEDRIRLLNEGLERRVRERTAELGQQARLIDLARDAIIVRSKGGVIASWNHGAARTYGWPADEASGRVSHDLLQTRFPLPLAEIEAELVRLGSWEGELSHERRDGSRIVVESRWVLDLDGSADGSILEINTDVTERRASEEALRRSEAALKESQRLAGVGSWEWDPTGDVVTWSDELYRIFGRDPAQPAPRYVEHGDLYTKESMERHHAAVMRALEAGEPYEIELEIVAGDGDRRWIVARGEAVRGPGGEVVKLRGTAQDVTARKRFEEELRRARDQAMAATRAKGEFLANMSHEIRTPMNGVIGMTELLLGTHLDDEQRGFAETIGASGEALLTVIDDILDFSKIEAGKMNLETSAFDLRGLIEGVVTLLTPEARGKGIDVGLDVESAIPDRLVGDPVRLRQVLLNLAGNAVKFTDRGRVDLAARRVAGSDSSETIRILVRDTGIGIPEDRQSDIFESFTQVEGGVSRRYGGTGLGLPICRSLVALMGGEIGLKSRPGEGSTFWFEVTLGRVSADAARPAPGVDSGRALAEPPSVLIAEDNEVNLRVAVGMLERLGCRVEAVRDGREAIEAIGRGRFDVVLMDVQMPWIDGFAATAAIRERELGTGVRLPILAMTAHAMRGDRERCLAAGMDGYLTKPIRLGPLREALREWSIVGDRTLTDALDEACGGDRGLMAAVVGVLLEETPGRLDRIDSAIAGRDGRGVYREAHALTGSFLAVGAESEAKACRELVASGRAGDFPSARAAFSRVVGLWGRLAADLARRASALPDEGSVRSHETVPRRDAYSHPSLPKGTAHYRRPSHPPGAVF